LAYVIASAIILITLSFQEVVILISIMLVLTTI
jgi:hypothetical protein